MKRAHEARGGHSFGHSVPNGSKTDSGPDTNKSFDLKRWIGRGERIRTSGLLVPNQALYQAEPRPEIFSIAALMGRRVS